MARHEKGDEHGPFRSKTAPIDPGASNVIQSLIPVALNSLSADENFIWSREHGQFMVNIPDGDQERWYSRTPSAGIRKNLDDNDSNDLDTAYWLAQAIHFGLRPSTSQDVIKDQLRKELQMRKGRLMVPERLLLLSYILQDKAEDDFVMEDQLVVKEEVRSDSESVDEDNDDAGDYSEDMDEDAGEDRDENASDDNDDDNYKDGDDHGSEHGGMHGNQDGDEASDYEDNHAPEPTRPQRLPIHADRPVRTIENDTDNLEISPQSVDAGKRSAQEGCENSDAERSPVASFSKNRRTDHRSQARSRKSLAQESRTRSHIQAGPHSATSKRSISVAVPDQFSDAAGYLTALSSSASSPRTSRVRKSGNKHQALTDRSAGSAQAEKAHQMGAEISKEASAGELPASQAGKSSHEARRNSVTSQISTKSPRHKDHSISRATLERGLLHYRNAENRPTAQLHHSQIARSETNLPKLTSVSQASPSKVLTSRQHSATSDVDLDELDEEEQVQLAIKLSKRKSQPTLPHSSTVNPANIRTWQQHLSESKFWPPYQIAPPGWISDDRAFPEMHFIMQEIKARMDGGLHGNDNIKFCIQLAAGDPDVSYWNYIDAARIEYVDARPMSVYHRWKPNSDFWRNSSGPLPRLVHRDTVVRPGSVPNHAASSSNNGAKSSGFASHKLGPAPNDEKTSAGKNFQVHSQGLMVSSTIANALPMNTFHTFEASRIRPWLGIDYMDMGVVYRAKKSKDGYLVRTHDGLLQDVFPQNVFNNGQMRLQQEEKLMRSLNMRIPPREGYEAKDKKHADLRKQIGKKSASSVILKPDEAVPMLPLPKGPQGNISYNGHSTNLRQLLAVGAAVQDSQNSVSTTTDVGEIELASKVSEPKSLQSGSKVAGPSQSETPDQLAADRQSDAVSSVQDKSPTATTPKKTKPLLQAAEKNQSEPRSTDVEEALEKDNNGKGRKRKNADEVTEQAASMDAFRKKVKKREADASAETLAADAEIPKAVPLSTTASPQHTTSSELPEAGQGRGRDLEATSDFRSTTFLSASVPQPVHHPTPPPSSTQVSGTAAQAGQASSQPQPPPSNTSAANSNDQGRWKCGWNGCDREPLATVALLHEPVRVVHVGYKANGNENLTCGWEGCDRTLASNQTAVVHIVQHVPYKSHVCSLCNRGYNRQYLLLQHVADEHSGGVLSGQGSVRPRSSASSTTTGTQAGTEDAPAVTRNTTDMDVEMRDADAEEVVSQEVDLNSDESADRESEEQDDSTESAQKGTKMKIEAKMHDTSTSPKQPFPQKLLPDKGLGENYYELDEESRLEEKKNRVNDLQAMSTPEGEEDAKLAKAIRSRDKWQLVVDGIRFGTTESAAELQLRLAQQQRQDLQVKVEASGEGHVETLKLQLSMASRKVKDAKMHIKRQRAARELAAQLAKEQEAKERKTEKAKSKDKKSRSKRSAESKLNKQGSCEFMPSRIH